METTGPPFVGRHREALVERLRAHVEETAAARRPRLVTLEAGTGWGKTRLVQELYARLAATQPSPGYWPPTVLGAAGGQLGLEARRKRLFPATFTPPEGAVPHWFWWGITASAHRSGTAVQALAQDLVQVEAHTPALERRWRQLAGVKEKAGRLLRGEDAAELGALLRDEGISRAAEAVVGSAIPGLGFLLWAGGVVWRQRQRWSAEHGAPHQIDAQGRDRTDLVTEVATSLASFTRVGIPIVIVVEDLHDADPSLVSFLTQVLSEPSGPVLVVATSWPGLLDAADVEAAALLTQVPSARIHRMRQPIELPDLETDALHALVSYLLPGATPSDSDVLTSRFTTPLTLEIACSVQSIRDAVEDGDLQVEDVDDLPRDVEGLYRVVWAQLPASTREALMLAALATPRMAGNLFREGSWDPGAVAGALSTLPWVDDAVREVLAETVGDTSAYAWVRRVDDWLRRFQEPAQLSIAVDASEEELGRRRRRAIYEALAAHLDPRDPQLSPSRRRWQAQMLVSLAAEDFVGWTEPVWEALDLLVDEAREEPDVGSLRTVVALLMCAPQGSDGERALLRRRYLGGALLGLGRLDEAIDVLSELVRLRSPEDPGDDYASDLDLLASALSDAGEADRALELTEAVWALLTDRYPDPSAPELWVARNNRALRLDKAGRSEEAVAALEELVADIGTVDASTRTYHTARTNLAACYAHTGDLVHAIFFSQTSAHMAESQYGSTHPQTLHALDAVLDAAWQAGATELARDVATRLSGLAVDVLGEDHPRTLDYLSAQSFLADNEPPVAPLDLPPWDPTDETLLVLGHNLDGDPIYTFVRLSPDRIDEIRGQMASGGEFRPHEWGTVVASGHGRPTPRVIALTGIPEYLIEFKPREDARDA